MRRAGVAILAAAVLAVGLFVALFAASREQASRDRLDGGVRPSVAQEPLDTQNVDLSLAELKAFPDFPVYWVGEEFGGYPLDRIIGPYPDQFESPVLVVYGTCGAAFETGCSPPLVIKTGSACIRHLSEPTKVRERMAGRESRRLVIQAGDVAVTIYAAPGLEAAAADNMLVVNPDAAPPYPSVVRGGPLPGSICELERLHPWRPPERAGPSPTPYLDETGQRSIAATVISAFGEFEVAWGFDEAEGTLGWKVLRSDDPRFTLVGYGVGALRRLDNSLFRLEQQSYWMIGHRNAIEVTQEPESYPDAVHDMTWDETVGRWTGRFEQGGDWISFHFFSSETINGQRVRVSVVGSDGYTVEDLRAFVQSLDFGP